MLSIDMETTPGQYVVQDDAQLHYFYVDSSPFAPDEKTTDNWPRGANCNSPLPTDGYPNGEYSVWILRAGCEWTNYISTRLRIKDDCNNWRRSENLSPQQINGVDIFNPPDGSIISDGDPVTFSAQVLCSSNSQSLAPLIKWSIQIYENGDWIEYGPNENPPYNVWEDKIYSIIENEDWLGPDFTIDAFYDCELIVRARLEVCGGLFDDTCNVEIEDTRSGQFAGTQVTDIGILVYEKHWADSYNPPNCSNLGAQPPWLMKNPSEGTCVLQRNSEGKCFIDYIVQVTSDIKYNSDGSRPSGIPPQEETIVSSPTEIGQPSTTVFLNYINTNSERHKMLRCLFGNSHEPCGEYTYYYDRGTDLVEIYDLIPTPGKISLKVSDRDIPEIRDYYIAWSHDTESQYYKPFIDDMFYGDDSFRRNRRGIFCKEFNSSNGKIIDYKSDILRGGMELIKVEAYGKEAFIGIQSRGDAIFAPIHGLVDYGSFQGTGDPAEDKEAFYIWQIETTTCSEIGPFWGEIPHDEEGISPNEFFNASDLRLEIDWLVSTACSLLSNLSIPLWKQNTSDNPFKSICGFRGFTERANLPKNFWSRFSQEFSKPPTGRSNLWLNNQVLTSDYAIIAWMETNCLYVRERKEYVEQVPMLYSGAIDESKLYYIEWDESRYFILGFIPILEENYFIKNKSIND